RKFDGGANLAQTNLGEPVFYAQERPPQRPTQAPQQSVDAEPQPLPAEATNLSATASLNESPPPEPPTPGVHQKSCGQRPGVPSPSDRQPRIGFEYRAHLYPAAGAIDTDTNRTPRAVMPSTAPESALPESARTSSYASVDGKAESRTAWYSSGEMSEQAQS